MAKEIAIKNNKAAVKELVENLSGKNKDIQNDCIKVLYEIGEIKPKLIAEYAKTFTNLLQHKNNRLQWGAMTALYTIVPENPKLIYSLLAKIIDASDKGSVITKDNAVKIMVRLGAVNEYAAGVFSLLNEQLIKSLTNQLPTYAELSIPVVNDKNKKLFVKTLSARLNNIEKDSGRKRVEKIIKKFS